MLFRSHHAVCCQKANLFVCSVLTAAMTEEKQHEIGHLPTAAEIWMEACCLYMGSTVTDWTLTIMALVTTHYNDGEDATAHITKMKTYCCDLLFMQRDIDDELFACFLHISMLSSWNYVFAALLEHYTLHQPKWNDASEMNMECARHKTILHYKRYNLKRSATVTTASSPVTGPRTAGHQEVQCMGNRRNQS